MYFQFDDSRPDTPSLDSAMSRREGVLISVVGHVAVLLLLLVVPSLPMVQEAAARRAREAALREARLLEQQRAEQHQAQRFVFVQPLVDIEAPEPPDAGFLSDRDRTATAPERAAESDNPLPFARGNAPDLVIAPDRTETAAGEGPRPDPADGDPAGEASDRAAEVAEAEPEGSDVETEGAQGEIARALAEADALARLSASGRPAGSAAGTPGVIAGAESPPPSGGALGEAIRNLQRYVDQESFDNPRGDGGQFGPSIQFDTKGVEFGPWIRRFIAQIKRNWLVPYAAMAFKGHTVITFNVHKSGALTDVNVIEPSTIASFNSSARNALLASNPTQPLPPEYPSDKAFFTVTFYYNERPPNY